MKEDTQKNKDNIISISKDKDDSDFVPPKNAEELANMLIEMLRNDNDIKD